jgi:hypothetical protein
MRYIEARWQQYLSTLPAISLISHYCEGNCADLQMAWIRTGANIEPLPPPIVLDDTSATPASVLDHGEPATIWTHRLPTRSSCVY